MKGSEVVMFTTSYCNTHIGTCGRRPKRPRPIFRGGRADVFDFLQNSETNLQNYWAFKLGSNVKSHIIIMYDV